MAVEPLVDAGEVAKYLKVHEKTVRKMACDGRIPGVRIGQSWRFRLSDIEDWYLNQLASPRRPRTLERRLA